MEKLDEQALRRPDFKAGVPVRLADGSVWHLRRPLVRFAEAENDEGFEVVLSLDDDGTFGRLRAAERSAEGGPAVLAAQLKLAGHLLRANYDLTVPQTAALVQFASEEDDEEGLRLHREVMAAVRGFGPKPSDGGGGAPPSPPEDSPGATGWGSTTT